MLRVYLRFSPRQNISEKFRLKKEKRLLCSFLLRDTAMPLYLYDLIDAPDKAAKDLLEPIAETFIEVVKNIDETPSLLLKQKIASCKHLFCLKINFNIQIL